MADFEQLPGELNLKLIPGDQLQINCDFNVDITGYTVTNSIYVSEVYVAGGGGTGYINGIGSQAASFTQSITSASNGQLLLDLPEDRSSLLTPLIGYRWYLRWVDTGGVTRTVLSGQVTPVAP